MDSVNSVVISIGINPPYFLLAFPIFLVALGIYSRRLLRLVFILGIPFLIIHSIFRSSNFAIFLIIVSCFTVYAYFKKDENVEDTVFSYFITIFLLGMGLFGFLLLYQNIYIDFYDSPLDAPNSSLLFKTKTQQDYEVEIDPIGGYKAWVIFALVIGIVISLLNFLIEKIKELTD